MIHFPKLQTKRLTIELQELTFEQSLELAAMPTHQFEAAITKFLNFVVKTVKGIESPSAWTVQERMFVVAHYLACTLDDEPNFSLGDGNYFDYLQETEVSGAFNSVEIGELGGDVWMLRHLTGEMSEAIERIAGQSPIDDRNFWLIGGMAAQLQIKDEKEPVFSSNDELDSWMLDRINTFSAYPESDFESLFIAYRINCEKLKHLFAIDFDEYGIVALPREADGGLPPARFPVSKCLSRTARDFSRVAA